MSLATRCTSCGTAFRVVQDQLKVSEGWVRCGRCNAGLQCPRRAVRPGARRAARRGRTHAGRPARGQPRAAAGGRGRSLPATRPSGRAESEDRETSRNDVDTTGERPRRAARRPGRRASVRAAQALGGHAPKPAGQLGARDRVEFSDARFDSDLFPDNAFEPRDRARRPARRPTRLPCRSRARRGPTSCAVPTGTRAGRQRRACALRSASPAVCCSRSFSHCRPPTTIRDIAGGALAVAASAARRLVPRSPVARIEAPRRIDDVAGRKHRADARPGARRFRPLGDAAQPQRSCALGAAVDRPEP